MIDTVFKALADPNRRRILDVLRKGDLSVNEIRQHLEITGATLSHHLDILKRADLVSSQRHGQSIRYSLNTSVFEDILVTISCYFQSPR